MNSGHRNATPLPRSFYDRDVEVVARELIGCRLVSRAENKLVSGWIVETEAYLSENDSACHGWRGMTDRNRVMFGPPGMAYVYPIHARHCLNAVTSPSGAPAAVLIRSVVPDRGTRWMQQRRGRENLNDLACGPGRLCQAFAVTRQQNGIDLTERTRLWIDDCPLHGFAVETIKRTARIGVTSAEDLPLRFVLADCPFASGPRRLR